MKINHQKKWLPHQQDQIRLEEGCQVHHPNRSRPIQNGMKIKHPLRMHLKYRTRREERTVGRLTIITRNNLPLLRQLNYTAECVGKISDDMVNWECVMISWFFYKKQFHWRYQITNWGKIPSKGVKKKILQLDMREERGNIHTMLQPKKYGIEKTVKGVYASLKFFSFVFQVTDKNAQTKFI